MLEHKNIVVEKVDKYTDRIVKLYVCLQNTRHESVMSKQILRSGTSIGANIVESKYAQSKADFKSKLMIALKEANETKYWLEKLKTGDYIKDKEFESMMNDNIEIIKLLTSITKTLKGRYEK